MSGSLQLQPYLLTSGYAGPASPPPPPPPGPPAWVLALQALAVSPSDLLFAYDFTSGGTGQGWDGTNNVTLTVGQTWEAAPWGSWDPTQIIDGLGLGIGGTSPVTLSGLLPTLAPGGTLLIQAAVYGTPTIDTVGWVFAHLVDLPDDNGEGGVDLKWRNAFDESVIQLTNSDGLPASPTDTITPKVALLRGAVNYLVDGNTILGSLNGRSNVSVSGHVSASSPNTVAVQNNGGTTDLVVYETLVAIFSLQPSGNLPTISALP